MNKATAEFIKEHDGEDVRRLALKGTKAPEVDLPFALDQIAGRQTARRKLPSWAETKGIVYPPHLSMEQCSGERSARYKARLVRGETLVDLTGGLGVDFSFMAQRCRKATYVERQKRLCELARWNFGKLDLQQAEVVCADAVEYLYGMDDSGMIYLDPARRDGQGTRTYGIADCTPNVLELWPLLLKKAGMVMVKLSPMLDWRKAVKDFGAESVSEVHIVSVGGECKELLIIGGGEQGDLRVVCVNLLPDGTEERLAVDIAARETLTSQASSPAAHTGAFPPDPSSLVSHFLYEPNASVMKAGFFVELAARYEVVPVAQNSHLFVSAQQKAGFPGRTFRIDAMTTMNKRDLKETLVGVTQANIAVRNFPLSVVELRKRLKIKEGGSNYLFATTLASGVRVLLLCSKVKA